MKKSVEGVLEISLLEKSIIETEDDVLTMYDMFSEFDGEKVRMTMETIECENGRES